MKKSTEQKIGIGIVIGVVVGVTVAIATIVLEEIIPKLPIIDELKGPQLKITGFSYRYNPLLDGPFGFYVSVYNEGKNTAQDCFVLVNDDRVKDSEPFLSSRFSLTPGEELEQISLVDGVYPDSKLITMEIQIVCGNSSSEVLIRTAGVDTP